MSFNQRLEIEFAVRGGIIGAFHKTQRARAIEFAKEYTEAEQVPCALLLELYEDSKQVTVIIFNQGERLYELVFSNYQDAWLGSQDAILRFMTFNEQTKELEKETT